MKYLCGCLSWTLLSSFKKQQNELSLHASSIVWNLYLYGVFSAWPLVRNSSSSATEEGIFVTKSRKLSGDRDSFSIVVVRLIYLSDENVICSLVSIDSVLPTFRSLHICSLVLIFGCGSNKSNITALVVPSLEHILSLKLHDAELGFSFISVFRLHFKISFSLSLSYLIHLNFISSTVLHVLLLLDGLFHSQGFDVQAAVSTSFFSWVSVIFSRANSNPAIWVHPSPKLKWNTKECRKCKEILWTT